MATWKRTNPCGGGREIDSLFRIWLEMEDCVAVCGWMDLQHVTRVAKLSVLCKCFSLLVLAIKCALVLLTVFLMPQFSFFTRGLSHATQAHLVCFMLAFSLLCALNVYCTYKRSTHHVQHTGQQKRSSGEGWRVPFSAYSNSICICALIANMIFQVTQSSRGSRRFTGGWVYERANI